jgi:hypothetical protein
MYDIKPLKSVQSSMDEANTVYREIDPLSKKNTAHAIVALRV